MAARPSPPMEWTPQPTPADVLQRLPPCVTNTPTCSSSEQAGQEVTVFDHRQGSQQPLEAGERRHSATTSQLHSPNAIACPAAQANDRQGSTIAAPPTTATASTANSAIVGPPQTRPQILDVGTKARHLHRALRRPLRLPPPPSSPGAAPSCAPSTTSAATAPTSPPPRPASTSCERVLSCRANRRRARSNHSAHADRRIPAP